MLHLSCTTSQLAPPLQSPGSQARLLAAPSASSHASLPQLDSQATLTSFLLLRPTMAPLTSGRFLTQPVPSAKKALPSRPHHSLSSHLDCLAPAKLSQGSHPWTPWAPPLTPLDQSPPPYALRAVCPVVITVLSDGTVSPPPPWTASPALAGLSAPLAIASPVSNTPQASN